MRVLHTGDLHFSNNPDKLEESIRTTDFILDQAFLDPPDVIIVAGDTVDEHDGRIRIDSGAARAAISFIQRAADIAPVIIVRGTKSHDRDTPYLFRHLHARHPIHVSDRIEMVALILTSGNGDMEFLSMQDYGTNPCPAKAFFTCIPSLDKATLIAQTEGLGIKQANTEAGTLFHDMFTALGEINSRVQDAPRIMVGHGMIIGSEFSSGQTAIGEDLEYTAHDLRMANCDLICFGHIHKEQGYYCGSPGRMNFGEREEKSFRMYLLDGQQVVATHNIPTPARRFSLHECTWDNGGLEAIQQQADTCELDCNGADVRFRFTVPEEEKHCVDRAELERRFVAAGARKVKVECQVLPVVRQRAAGISNLSTLPEKVQRWGEVTEQEIPPLVMDLAAVIEGRDVEELIAEALIRIEDCPEPIDLQLPETPVAEDDQDIPQALNF